MRISQPKALTGKVGQTVQLLGAAVLAAALTAGLYAAAVLWAVPDRDMPSSYKWLLLQDTGSAPRVVIEGGSSGHHGIDTDALSAALGVTAINIADNAGYDLGDKIARLKRFARAGDTVVLQLEWSYYLRNGLTDDYLSVLFGALPDYVTTQGPSGQIRRALTVPAPALWDALAHRVAPKAPDAPPVLTEAQRLDIAALEGPSGHVSYAAARTLAPGVEGQSCDAYLFGAALEQGALAISPDFRDALHRLQALKARGVRVLFAWPIVAGDDCYTSDIGLPALRDQVQDTVQAAGFSFLGAMTDTRFPGVWRDDTPYHLITAGTARRTDLLVAALRAEGVTGPGALELRDLVRADIYARELRLPGPDTLTPLPMDADLPLGGAGPDQLRFVAGWWQDEPSGRWMRGKDAVLDLALDPALPQGRALALAGFTYGDQARRMGVFHDGMALTTADVQGEFALSVPLDAVPRGRPVRLTLRVLDDLPVASPAATGQGEDLRSLSLHVRSLSLGLPPAPLSAPPPAVPPSVPPSEPPSVPAQASLVLPVPSGGLAVPSGGLAAPSGGLATPIICLPGQAASCQRPTVTDTGGALTDLAVPARIALQGDAQARLTGGWWAPETGGRWIGAQDAAITLHLPAQMTGPMGLRIAGTPFNAPSLPVEVRAAGTLVFQGVLTAEAPISLTLPVELAGQDVPLVLQFPGVDIRCPQALGLAEDARTLVVFITGLETFVPGADG